MTSFAFNYNSVGTKKSQLYNIEYYLIEKITPNLLLKTHILYNISCFDIYLINESRSMSPGKCLSPLMIWSMSFKQRMELKSSLFPTLPWLLENLGFVFLSSCPPFFPSLLKLLLLIYYFIFFWYNYSFPLTFIT